MKVKNHLTLRVVLSLVLVALLLANTFSFGMPGKQAHASSQAPRRLQGDGDGYIKGLVRAGSGAGVPQVEANGWQRDGKAWAHDETDEEGRFSLGVAGGSWEVMIHPLGGGETDWVYDGYPKKVTFAEDETTKEIIFTVQLYSRPTRTSSARYAVPTGSGLLRGACGWRCAITTA